MPSFQPGQASPAPGDLSLSSRAALLRDGLLLALTLVAGYLDAVAYLGLGNVFIANMTGNTVLLGLSVGLGRRQEALRNGIAFAGFAAGALAGARVAGRGREHVLWPARVTATLCLELLLAAIFTAGWRLGGAQPSGNGLFVLSAIGAAAMGVQSAAARRLAVAGVSTTYVTGTLTTLMGELAILRGPRSPVRHAAVLVTLAVGAVLGALTVQHWHGWAPLTPLAVLALVTALAALRFRTERAARRHAAG